MGYADNLYSKDNITGGYRIPVVTDENGQRSGGTLETIYFRKDDLFGELRRGKGRRIAMKSKGYKDPWQKHSNAVAAESIWSKTIHEIPRGCTLEKHNENNREELERLLINHPELNPDHKYDFAAALYRYARNLEKTPRGLYNYSPRAWEMTRTIRKYLEATRPGGKERQQDRQRAFSEYQLMLQEFENNPRPLTPAFTVYEPPRLTPPVSPEETPTRLGALAGAPLVQPIIGDDADDRDRNQRIREIINRPAVPRPSRRFGIF